MPSGRAGLEEGAAAQVPGAADRCHCAGTPPPAPVEGLCRGRGWGGAGRSPGVAKEPRERWAAPAAFVVAGAGGFPAGAPAGCGRGPAAPALGRPAGNVGGSPRAATGTGRLTGGGSGRLSPPAFYFDFSCGY